MKQAKRPPKQVRLEEDIEAEIKKIAEVTGLSEVEIIRQMVKAGVIALKEIGYALPTPLRVRVLAREESGQPAPSPLRYSDPKPQLNEVKDAPLLKRKKTGTS